jgi:predicted MFS family arabinose efflux permease
VTKPASAAASNEARRPLEALNFFMADMQAGVGPFLGVFLSQHGWRTGAIGTVMTLGGVAGVLVTAPAGALVDHTRRKRTYVILSGLFTVLASALIWLSQSFWVIAASQVSTAIAGAAIGPAVVGMTLGIVRQQGFNQQNGRNQAFNHAGNMVGAGLSGLLGWMFGLVAVFWLAAVFALLSVISVPRIPRRLIDDQAARGLAEDQDAGAAEALGALLQSKPLRVLAACLALFHLGNGGLLPLYGLAVVQAH